MGTFREDRYIFMTTPRSFLFRTRNVSSKGVERMITHILRWKIPPPRKSCRLWDHVEKCRIREPDRPQMTVWRMRIECWAPKATNAHTQNIQHILLFHGNSGCTNSPLCYVIHALSVLFVLYNVIVCILPLLHTDALFATATQDNLRHGTTEAPRWVHTCNVTAYRNAVTLQVTDTIWSYVLNFHPVPHGVILSTGFPVCYGNPSDVFAVSSGFVRLYTLHFKEKEERAEGGDVSRCTSRLLRP